MKQLKIKRNTIFVDTHEELEQMNNNKNIVVLRVFCIQSKNGVLKVEYCIIPKWVRVIQWVLEKLKLEGFIYRITR